MLQQVLKIIWNQRRQNGWIFIELSLVLLALWAITDMFVVQTYSYLRPLGYDVENCWRFTFDKYPEGSAEYSNDSTQLVSNGEALTRILERIRLAPEVEDACVAFYSSPYSFGNTWSSLVPLTPDSLQFKDKSFHRYVASVEYYNVFRIRTKDGKPLDANTLQVLNSGKGMLISVDMEKTFFGDKPGIGQWVGQSGQGESDNPDRVEAVINSIRENDFVKPEPVFFKTLSPTQVVKQTNYYGVTSMETTVRMRQTLSQQEMNDFLTRMGSQLTDSNVYVSGAESWVDQRDIVLSDNWQKLTTFLLLGIFTLLNVFFGIIGTFWLRIEQRRSETGTRMALGSSRSNIGWLFVSEGWMLLFFALPLVLIAIFNLCYMDVTDLYNLEFTWWRFLLGLGGAFFLMGIMIAIGTWIPARRAMKMSPAEALHYE